MNQHFRVSTVAVLVTCAVACSTNQGETPIVPWLDASTSGVSVPDAATTMTGAAGGTAAGGATSGGATSGGNTAGGAGTAGGGSAGAAMGGIGGATTGGVGGMGAVAGAGGDAGLDAGTVGGGDAAADAALDAAGDATSDGSTDGAAEDAGPFQACVQALKPKCGYADNEMACSSIMTAPIPLKNGSYWPRTELVQGPYGTYVEWNEGKAFSNPENLLEGTCSLAAASFGEPDAVTKDVLNLRGQQLSLYTIFRPACMRAGEKYPVITWGNGTCGQSGGYGPLLATVASHGFVVIASNSRWTNQGNKEMLRALDLAKAMNADTQSIFYQKLDLAKVGAMGHSQGGMATIEAAKDARVKAVIIWNGGSSAVKPFLAVSGDRDISDPTVAGLSSQVNAAAQPGAWLFYHKVLETGGNATGHLTLMMQPDRVAGPAVAWWKYMLNGDAEAKKMFVGTDCGLCNKKEDYEYGQHNLP